MGGGSQGINIIHFLVCVFLTFLDFYEIMFMEKFFSIFIIRLCQI